MKFKSVLGVIAAIAGLWMCAGSLLAQDDNGGGPGGPPGGGPGSNFDPAQFRQRMMEQTRKNLDVTNDDEWGCDSIAGSGVGDGRAAGSVGGGGMGMGFGGPPPGGGPGGPGGRGGFGPQPSAEQKELQKVVDANGPALHKSRRHWPSSGRPGRRS